jgi:hypothetical protein
MVLVSWGPGDTLVDRVESPGSYVAARAESESQ